VEVGLPSKSSDCVQLTSANCPTCLSLPIPDSHVERFSESIPVKNVERLSLPILDSQVEQLYAEESCPPTVIWNCDVNTCNAPLETKPMLSQFSILSPGDLSCQRHDDSEQGEVTACNDRVEAAKTLSRSCFTALADAYGDLDDYS